MKKLFVTFIYLILVSISYSQVTSDDLNPNKEKTEKFKKETPKSSNWISFSTGSNFFTTGDFIMREDTCKGLLSEINYSHRYFFNSNQSINFDLGFYATVGILRHLSLYAGIYGALFYRHQFKSFSVNAGLGLKNGIYNTIGVDFLLDSKNELGIKITNDYQTYEGLFSGYEVNELFFQLRFNHRL
jgi:hypothetical protein